MSYRSRLAIATMGYRGGTGDEIRYIQQTLTIEEPIQLLNYSNTIQEITTDTSIQQLTAVSASIEQ